ncbi:transcriptional regulator GcvA [Marinomonas agarivorans]|nr:transcriptional regulator GcvA [Marinomonas agarivorans]
MKRLPPLNTLRCFEAAARHGSFIKAANELSVTPSAVSHQIKSLESFLGVALFFRSKRRVTLSDAGKEYLAPISAIFTQLEEATTELMDKKNSGGVLKLSVAPAFLSRWLMPRMESFQDQYPDVQIEIIESTTNVDFDATQIDMAVYFGDGDWPGLEKHFLRNASLAPVCNPSLLKPNQPIRTPDDMRFYPLLHVAKRKHEWNEWLTQNGYNPKQFLRGLMFSNGALTASAAVQGLGIALVDPSFIASEIHQGSLRVLFNQHLITESAFYLVYPNDHAVSSAMKAFQKWIIEQMAEENHT